MYNYSLFNVKNPSEVFLYFQSSCKINPPFFPKKIYIKSTSLSYICSLNIHTTNKLDICHLQIYNLTQNNLQRDWYKHQNNILAGMLTAPFQQ